MTEPPITRREAIYLGDVRRVAHERDELRKKLAATEQALTDLRTLVEQAITDARLDDVNRSAMWRSGAKAIVAKVRLALVVAARSSSSVGGTQ